MSFDNGIILDILIECSDYILERLEVEKLRLSDYNYLQGSLLATNVVEDKNYQRIYKRYYAMDKLGWNSEWDESYFSLLERMKYYDHVLFPVILSDLRDTTGRIETSFGSKLIATINPEMPVYDKWVRENLGLKPPYPAMAVKRRRHRFIEIYSELQLKSSEITGDDKFRKLSAGFDQRFPVYKHFTDIKKLDLFLWQARYKSKRKFVALVPYIIESKT